MLRHNYNLYSITDYTVEIKNYTVIFDDTETKFIILFKLKV